MRARFATLALFTVLTWTVTACTSPDRPIGETAPQAAGANGVATPDSLRFTATTVDEQPFDGVALTGKPTVLWFWEPSCAKCRAQGPETTLVADLYEGEINVVGVAGAGGTAFLREFIASTGTRQLRHLADPGRAVWERFDATKPGTYVLLDAMGRVAVRGTDLDGRLPEAVAPLTR